MAKVVRKKGDFNLDKLKVFIDDLDRKKLQVGWLESARYDDQTPVAGIAAIQEFGSAKRSIPPRPFLRPTVADKKAEWTRILTEGFKAVVAGHLTTEQLLEQLGLLIVGQIKTKISTINAPALSPVTLALRKQKLAGKTITGKIVGATAAAVEAGETGPGELGDSSGVNPKPLVFTSLMLTTLTHEVSDA